MNMSRSHLRLRNTMLLLAMWCIGFQAEAANTPASSTNAAYDVTENPGCGKTGLTKEQKIARNYAMAKHFHQIYATGVSRQSEKYIFNMNSFGCFAKDMVMVGRLFDPKLTAAQAAANAGPPKDRDFFFTGELRTSLEFVPDLAAVPEADGGFVAFPSENGVTLNVVWEGHYKNRSTDRPYQYWETYHWKINDAGQITEWWLWSDTLRLQDFMRTFTGDPALNFVSMTPAELRATYFKFLKDRAEKRGE